MGALRVTFWGALAIAFTAGAGALFGEIHNDWLCEPSAVFKQGITE
jgi:hypothetical protein